MDSCRGYNIDSCHLPRKSTFEYCGSCLFEKNNIIFLKFIQDIKSNEKTNEQIMETFNSVDIQTFLSSYIRWVKDLDEFFSSLYYHRPTLLHNITKAFQKKASLNINLILRIIDHSKTPMCDVYVYFMKKNMMNEYIYPNNCIHCLSHYIACAEAFGDDPLTKSIVLNDCKRLLKIELGSKKYFFRSYSIIRSLAESRHFPIKREEIHAFIGELIKIASEEYSPGELEDFQKKVYEHPLLVQQEPRFIKSLMKKHTESWKLEWLAKSLHPSRVQAWCFDQEELEEWKEFGGINDYIPIQKGKKAEWNIDW